MNTAKKWGSIGLPRDIYKHHWVGYDGYVNRLLAYIQQRVQWRVIAIICLISLSSLVTVIACQYQNKTLRLRNKFLEQRYLEQLKQGGTVLQPTVVPQPDQEKWEHVYQSRDGTVLTTVYWSPGDYGLDVATTDLNTHQELSRHSENSYFKLLKHLEGMFTNSLESIFLKTEGATQYAIVDTFIGNIDEGDSAREIYVATFDSVKELLTLKSFRLEPFSVKSGMVVRTYFNDEILDYFPKQNQLLVNTSSGDGCGGMGTVKLFSSGAVNETIKEIGMGCSLQTRYLGYINNLLYFGEIDQSKQQSANWEDATITQVYSFNPLTRERVNLQLNLTGYALDSTWKDETDQISSSELLLYDKDLKEGFALNVNTVELRSVGKLYQ